MSDTQGARFNAFRRLLAFYMTSPDTAVGKYQHQLEV